MWAIGLPVVRTSSTASRLNSAVNCRRRRFPFSAIRTSSHRRCPAQGGNSTRLIYSAITSLDGYTADEDGNFDWAAPDEEVHTFVNDLERPVGTYLYGRRMYEVMAPWETEPTLADQSRVMREFAELWQAADKVVYSKTLETVSTASTRIERDFDPEAVRQMKTQAERDITVGGPNLAAQAIK